MEVGVKIVIILLFSTLKEKANFEIQNNLKARIENGGRCKNCNHPFVFDPQVESKFTDILFNNYIQTISSENTLFFTSKQLWYFIEKRLRKKGDIGSVFSLFL